MIQSSAFYPYFILILFFLFAHALADYPLQNDFLAKAKNRLTPVPGMQWWICLSWHAVIHAGFVLLLTGSSALFLAEFVFHWIIDDAKCKKNISFVGDQILHVLCKLLYVFLIFKLPILGFHSPILYFFK